MDGAMTQAKLAAALVAAQAAARAVAKDATNTFHRYRYASAESIIEEARSALSGAGLSVSVSKAEILRLGEGTDVYYYLEAVYLLEHASGESRPVHTTVPIVPEKGRPLDKALAAARTYSLGYLLRDLLLLPRVEEGADVDQRDDRPRPERPERPGPVQAPTPPPSDNAARAFSEQIAAAPDERELAAIGREISRVRASMLEADVRRLQSEWAARRAALTGAAA